MFFIIRLIRNWSENR